MTDQRIERILELVEGSGADVAALLKTARGPELIGRWREDPRPARAFARALIARGQPTRAFELASEGLGHHPDDRRLLYLAALAMARGRNRRKSEEYLSRLLAR